MTHSDPYSSESTTVSRAGTVRSLSIIALMHELGTELPWSVLSTLAAGNQCVGRIAESLGIPQTYVSKSLRRLGTLGLVRYSREGNRHVYHINQEQVAIRSNGELELALRSTDGSRIALTFSAACLQNFKFPPPAPEFISAGEGAVSSRESRSSANRIQVKSTPKNEGRYLRQSSSNNSSCPKPTARGRDHEMKTSGTQEPSKTRQVRSRSAKSGHS